MRSPTFLLASLGFGLVAVACAPPQEPEDAEPLGVAVQADTVAQAAGNSCATSSVKGLSLQIAAQGACIEPGSFVEVPQVGNVVFADTVLPFLEQPAKDALLAALADAPGTSMQINSMLRTVAQQYLLYQWYLAGTCGISLAATPGNSNHETGVALDGQQYNTWKPEGTGDGGKGYGRADGGDDADGGPAEGGEAARARREGDREGRAEQPLERGAKEHQAQVEQRRRVQPEAAGKEVLGQRPAPSVPREPDGGGEGQRAQQEGQVHALDRVADQREPAELFKHRRGASRA